MCSLDVPTNLRGLIVALCAGEQNAAVNLRVIISEQSVTTIFLHKASVSSVHMLIVPLS